MANRKFWSCLALGFFAHLALGLTYPVDAGDCLKEKWGHCLGGAGEASSADGVTVRIHEGRVAVIERSYKPGSWAEYSSLLQRIEGNYGEAVHDELFLDGYDTPTHKQTAVALRQGWIKDSWPQTGWTLWLIWVDSREVIVRYSTGKLEAAAAKDEF